MKKVICNVMAICLLAGSGISCGAQDPVERTEVQFIYYLMELEQQLAAAKKKQEAEKKAAVKKEESKTSVASKILKGLAIALGVAGTAVAGACVHNHVANRQSFYVKGIFEQIKEHIQSLVNNRVCPETSFVEKAKHVVSDLYYRLYYKGQGICQVTPKCFADELNVCDIN